MSSLKFSVRNNAWQAGNGSTMRSRRFDKHVAFMLWNTIFMLLRNTPVFVQPMDLCKINTHIHKQKKPQTVPQTKELWFWLFPQLMSLHLTYIDLVKGGITCKNICIMYANIFSWPTTTFLLLAYHTFYVERWENILKTRD